ncbi:MAG: VIT1/CCC1 transporter family protein [Nanoarchaeota archaeon]
MKKSIKKGFGFGITSGIITTLGLIVGLYSGTNSKFIVLGGIFMIAIADSLSDALGIHISEESVNKNKNEIWESTVSTFVFKFIFASIFIIPFLFLQLKTAIIFCVVMGLLMLSIFSYYISREHKTNPVTVILEHLIIAIVVIIITYFAGFFVSGFAG